MPDILDQHTPRSLLRSFERKASSHRPLRRHCSDKLVDEIEADPNGPNASPVEKRNATKEVTAQRTRRLTQFTGEELQVKFLLDSEENSLT
jgi:hypothetical protein